MDIENFVNQLNGKKIALIGIVVVIVLFIFHEILFWSLFKDTTNMFSSIATQIAEQQKDIQKQIADSDKEFKARGDDMDELSANFDKNFRKMQTEMNDYMEKAEREQAERDKAFDEAYKRAPAEMMAMFQKAEDDMEKNYFKQSAKMQDDFQKHIKKFGLDNKK